MYSLCLGRPSGSIRYYSAAGRLVRVFIVSRDRLAAQKMGFKRHFLQKVLVFGYGDVGDKGGPRIDRVINKN